MNIQGLPQHDDERAEIELCQQVLEVLNDISRLWLALPQCPEAFGDCPGDPDWTPPSSS